MEWSSICPSHRVRVLRPIVAGLNMWLPLYVSVCPILYYERPCKCDTDGRRSRCAGRTKFFHRRGGTIVNEGILRSRLSRRPPIETGKDVAQ